MTDRWGRNPLHYLSNFCSEKMGTEKDVRIAKMLLEHGTPLEVQDEEGLTPLASAVWHGNDALAALLIAKGASATTKDHYGRTPLHYALDCEGRCASRAPPSPGCWRCLWGGAGALWIVNANSVLFSVRLWGPVWLGLDVVHSLTEQRRRVLEAGLCLVAG